VVSRPRPNCNLPSWVIDWACKEDPGYSYLHFEGLQRDKFNASFYTLNTSIGILQALQADEVSLDRLCDDPTSFASRQFVHRSLQGFFVLCSDLARHDDELWVLNGCGVLLVLRAEQDYGYKLISGAALSAENGFVIRQDDVVGMVQARKEEQGGWQSISII
jgi:hypothetical protein